MNTISGIETATLKAAFKDAEGMETLLKRIEGEAKDFAADVGTKKGRAAIKSFAYSIAQGKGSIDRFGKDLGEAARKKISGFNAGRNAAAIRLDALRDTVRKPLDDWEAAEEKRIEGHKERLQTLLDAARRQLHNAPTEEIEELLKVTNEATVDQSWEEFELDARRAKDDAIENLTTFLNAAKKRDQEAEELERLRKESDERATTLAAEAAEKEKAAQAEQDEQERRAEEKREAEAAEARRVAEAERLEEMRKQALADAEETRKVEAQEAQQLIDEANERAETAAQDERNRIAGEEAERKAKREASEADSQNRRRVFGGIYNSLLEAGLNEAQAETVVTAMREGRIPHLSIDFTPEQETVAA